MLFLTMTCIIACADRHGDEAKNVFFYLWIIVAFASTCYTFIWDVKMDWGLFDRNAKENRFLREEIVYAHKVCNLSICVLLTVVEIAYNSLKAQKLHNFIISRYMLLRPESILMVKNLITPRS